MRPEKGSALCAPRDLDALVNILPEEMEVKSYQLTGNDRIRGIYELELDVVAMTKAEYINRALHEFEGLDVTSGLFPTRDLMQEFVKKPKSCSNRSMLYAHDVSFSIMNKLLDIPPQYRLSALNSVSGFSDLLEGKIIDGVNTSMTYYSVVPSGSSWHEEDFGLMSANWLAPGSDSKYWIGKTVQHQTDLIRPIRTAYRHSCANPLSHKDYFVDFDFFGEPGFSKGLYYAEQRGGDIVISTVAVWWMPSCT
ncbi:hypothetical protein AAVH_19890 [Aphelenchoides avenae]|nr:hypothetical protein AAVH_19890 [Aphelenchus avenae]